LGESNKKELASDKEQPSALPSSLNNSRTEPSQQRGEASGRYQSIVLVVILMGVMMTAIDTTAVVLALPVMVNDLKSNILSMVWVIMAYLLVLTIFGTQVGRLGDMYGRVRMYNVGFAIFTIGSLLCGLSQTGAQIIDFRIIQGLGGALVFSNSGAIIADTIPATRRGRAYGLTGIGYSVGAILGILVGGVLITFLNWRYIFYINVPIGIAAVVASYLILKERSPRISRRIDFLGMSLLGIGLFLILYALTEITGSGWTDSSGFELFAGGLLIIGFVLWERYFTSPLLALSLLRQRVLTASIFAAFFQAIASFAVLFLVIMYLQGVGVVPPFLIHFLHLKAHAFHRN
jgi:MFS family permease